MGDVFVPSEVLGALFMSTMQGHVSLPKVHCPDHCVQCEAILWLADNAPDMTSVAVAKGSDIQDWQWQNSDGSIDWRSVRSMFSTPEMCLSDHHEREDDGGSDDDDSRGTGPESAG